MESYIAIFKHHILEENLMIWEDVYNISLCQRKQNQVPNNIYSTIQI